MRRTLATSDAVPGLTPLSGVDTSSTSGPAVINRLHDFFGPPNRVRDCAHSRRNTLASIELR